MSKIYAPASKKQEMFLNSNATITIAGGAAGSGKTFTSLLIALKFMQHPRATGVIFRRVSKMLTAPGSIWHEAVAMYSEIYPKGLTIRNRDLEIVFPNGALLKFSHMQHESNMYDHKGGQYSLVIFDEGTDFTEPMVEYLLSRMRNAYVNYTPQMFIMTNPDYNSFLRTWIQDYYLDSEGIPIEERAGHKRFFYKQGDKKFWANSEQELKDLYGNVPIMSLAFIGARCVDNPPLMLADPTYKDRLMSLPDVEVKRLYWGSWFARAVAAGSWKREWCNVVHQPNLKAKKRVRAFDIAGSLPSPAYPDPDWTRGVLVSKDDSGVYTVEDMVSLRDRFHKVEELIFQTAIKDGHGTTIVLPCDPNAQAGAWAKGMQRKLGEMGFNCRLIRPTKSKAMRFAPFSTISQSGFVEIVEGEWYQDFATELENFDMNATRQKDDIVDSISDCIFTLNQGTSLPTFELSALSMQSSSTPTLGFNGTSISDLKIHGTTSIPSSGLLS
jgi:predicted phage terminase large subunit-like protein